MTTWYHPDRAFRSVWWCETDDPTAELSVLPTREDDDEGVLLVGLAVVGRRHATTTVDHVLGALDRIVSRDGVYIVPGCGGLWCRRNRDLWGTLLRPPSPTTDGGGASVEGVDLRLRAGLWLPALDHRGVPCHVPGLDARPRLGASVANHHHPSEAWLRRRLRPVPLRAPTPASDTTEQA